MRSFGIFLVLLVAVAGVMPAGVLIDKVPDQGAYWSPLSPNSTYIYADSFVLDTGTNPTATVLGAYLLAESSPSDSPFRFELWGDAGNSPDPNSVLGVTGYLQDSGTDLHLATADLLSPVPLTVGTRYWVIASTVGQTGDTSYQFGGHTQNSIYQDNGTFWYSNDPEGLDFDGQAMLPEMAIYVAGEAGAGPEGAIPEPATLALLGSGLAFMAWRRRRSA